ncbi:hypothetical protein VTK26DRAFT_3543 [Humicola hyalothermophila]
MMHSAGRGFFLFWRACFAQLETWKAGDGARNAAIALMAGPVMGWHRKTTRHVRSTIITHRLNQHSGAVGRYKSNVWTILHMGRRGRDGEIGHGWMGYTAWFWLRKSKLAGPTFLRFDFCRMCIYVHSLFGGNTHAHRRSDSGFSCRQVATAGKWASQLRLRVLRSPIPKFPMLNGGILTGANLCRALGTKNPRVTNQRRKPILEVPRAQAAGSLWGTELLFRQPMGFGDRP